jgi:ribosomal protein S18 acetylase RimI-like enzyme
MFYYFMKVDYEFPFRIQKSPQGFFACIPYVAFSEIYFFRQMRFFVTLEDQVLGVLALQEKDEALYISVLAVSPFFRKTGVATYMLDYAAAIANKLDKAALELSVSKANAPALSLYLKYGFRKKKERRRSWILRKTIEKAR